MRRALSILLVVFFGLGPLTATLQDSDDIRLPACCRRGGAHHCAMDDAALARIIRDSGIPAFSAPSHCPLYPHGLALTIAPVHAIASSFAVLTALVQICALAALKVKAFPDRAFAHAGRGPPAAFLV